MKARAEASFFRAAGFRLKLMLAMMLVVAAVTVVAVSVADQNLARAAARELQREFRAELAALHNVQALREAALLERCRALVRKPRIHAALEDGAFDLLYPSSRDELRDIMASAEGGNGYALHAEFYRFLGRDGRLLAPDRESDAGHLDAAEAAQLRLPAAPDRPQFGYLLRTPAAVGDPVTEIVAMPILSTETGEAIAALVLGFKPAVLAGSPSASGIRRGLWHRDRLHLPGLEPGEDARFAAAAARAVVAGRAGPEEQGAALTVNGRDYLFFHKQLNPGSLYPPAFEVCAYPLAGWADRQRRVRWQVIGAGGALLLGGLAASHLFARRLSAPVEQLAEVSAENVVRRAQAEAALETTSEELQRAERFSADASHQLRTPVAVLRAGLEELQARPALTPEVEQEIAALIRQTYRLSGVIDDLLLLSRMDAGRLTLQFSRLNLSALAEAALDDLSTRPDAPALAVESRVPPEAVIAGEKRYVGLILQNLLENARKYNRPGGRIALAIETGPERVRLTVGNTGRGIEAETRGRIFERFHRGNIGENVPGYGLGLNLARELARLHRGDLTLQESREDWTAFAVWFPVHRDSGAEGGA